MATERAHPEFDSYEKRRPTRGPLPPDVESATRTVHQYVWHGPYVPGEGPMHYAGGPYWRKELLRRADRWERQAAAARICATVFPTEEDDAQEKQARGESG